MEEEYEIILSNPATTVFTKTPLNLNLLKKQDFIAVEDSLTKKTLFINTAHIIKVIKR